MIAVIGDNLEAFSVVNAVRNAGIYVERYTYPSETLARTLLEQYRMVLTTEDLPEIVVERPPPYRPAQLRVIKSKGDEAYNDAVAILSAEGLYR